MNLKFIIAICLVFASFIATGQTCALGVGTSNPDTVIEVFQLNNQQIEKLKAVKVAYVDGSQSIEQKIEKLLKEHPQSSPADLTLMAEKYNVLKEEMIALSLKSDEEVLTTFNQKQYERYLLLCKETYQRPIVVTPTVYNDSIVKE